MSNRTRELFRESLGMAPCGCPEGSQYCTHPDKIDGEEFLVGFVHFSDPSRLRRGYYVGVEPRTVKHSAGYATESIGLFSGEQELFEHAPRFNANRLEGIAALFKAEGLIGKPKELLDGLRAKVMAKREAKKPRPVTREEDITDVEKLIAGI